MPRVQEWGVAAALELKIPVLVDIGLGAGVVGPP